MKTPRLVQAKIDFLFLFEEDGEFVKVNDQDPKNPGFITASVTRMASEIPGMNLEEVVTEVIAELAQRTAPLRPVEVPGVAPQIPEAPTAEG